MICTCDACHYTFKVETPDLPSFCPDCGRKTINRRVNTRLIPLPAVREATPAEVEWYEKVQAELKEEEEQAADQAKKVSRLLQAVDHYAMSDDEHNWATVLAFVFGATGWDMLRKRIIDAGDPEWIEKIYMDVRRDFTRSVNEDRTMLKRQGKSEPIAGVYDLTDDGFQLRDGLDEYGPALAVLYRFALPDQEKILLTPTLGDLRRINLRAIAQNPSPGYKRFLMDWE